MEKRPLLGGSCFWLLVWLRQGMLWAARSSLSGPLPALLGGRPPLVACRGLGPAAGCLVASWLVNWRVDASKILFLVCFFVKLGRSCWSARVCSDRFSLLGHFVLFVVQGFVRCAWMGRLPVHGRSGGCLGA